MIQAKVIKIIRNYIKFERVSSSFNYSIYKSIKLLNSYNRLFNVLTFLRFLTFSYQSRNSTLFKQKC